MDKRSQTSPHIKQLTSKKIINSGNILQFCCKTQLLDITNQSINWTGRFSFCSSDASSKTKEDKDFCWCPFANRIHWVYSLVDQSTLYHWKVCSKGFTLQKKASSKLNHWTWKLICVCKLSKNRSFGKIKINLKLFFKLKNFEEKDIDLCLNN